MEKYLDPMFADISGCQKQYLKFYQENPKVWRDEVDRLIMDASKGKLRVFQTFFNSPGECFSGNFSPQALEEKDIKAMYPKFIESTKNIPPNTYCYIFTCNGVLNNGKDALIIQSFITF